MRVAAIQSSFIPWSGYFDFIASVDLFVIYDDVQYSSGSWRNRNRIKTISGTNWLTVPVKRKNLNQKIVDVEIDYSRPWQRKHSGAWSESYHSAPHFVAAMGLLEKYLTEPYETISQLNVSLIHRLCDYLGLTTPLIHSSNLDLQGHKTDRLIDLLKKLNATTYLSGPSADAYLEKEAFLRNDIQLEYKSYDYAPYPQLLGGFIGEVTVLDLIANCGPDAQQLIRSRTPDRIIVRK